MNIIINDTPIETLDGETLLEAAKRAGYEIPSLCYAKGAKHKSSCMVCAVKNMSNGQVMPSCTTLPTKGMQIETDSEEIHTIRTLSLELLLSDHRADCEAPCSLVCPKELDVERVIGYYDNRLYEKAYKEIAKAFNLPEIGCDTCKAPCEKACRRGTIDKAVTIRSIIKEIVDTHKNSHINNTEQQNITTANSSNTSGVSISVSKEQQDIAGALKPEYDDNNKQALKADKNRFLSRLGRFTTNEKESLKATVSTASRCLHCACTGNSDCKLRKHATTVGIKRPRYEASSTLPAMIKQQIGRNMWFEQAKCIRCGLCVYNSENGFTFKDRGFGMQVILPEENRVNIKEELATLCPTGAIYCIG